MVGLGEPVLAPSSFSPISFTVAHNRPAGDPLHDLRIEDLSLGRADGGQAATQEPGPGPSLFLPYILERPATH